MFCKMRLPLASFLLGLLIISSCRETKSFEDLESFTEILEEKDTLSKPSEKFTQEDQENIQRLIGLTLKDQYKEDIELGIVDSLSRKYKYVQVDINEDSNKEILVGLTGPYFCGSGGCTFLLLNYHGDIITQFSVVRMPVYLDTEKSNGWNNLIVFSGGENRLVKFDGNSYPSNPSTQEIFSGDLEKLEKLMDWESLETFSF